MRPFSGKQKLTIAQRLGPNWQDLADYFDMKWRNLMHPAETQTTVVPQCAVPTMQAALATVNRWLHRELGTAVHAAAATFDPATFYWHITIELAYGATGQLGQVGDVYLHATTGVFAGAPQAEEFRQRAEALAAVYEIE